MAGVTNSGFQPKTLSEIRAEKNEDLRQTFGRDINLESTSSLGQLSGVSSRAESNIWDAMSSTYNSFHLNTSSEANLDNIVVNAGINRIHSTKTSGFCYFFGTVGSLVPSRTQIRSSNNIILETLK